jgi:hypothetical protein
VVSADAPTSPQFHALTDTCCTTPLLVELEAITQPGKPN